MKCKRRTICGSQQHTQRCNGWRVFFPRPLRVLPQSSSSYFIRAWFGDLRPRALVRSLVVFWEGDLPAEHAPVEPAREQVAALGVEFVAPRGAARHPLVSLATERAATSKERSTTTTSGWFTRTTQSTCISTSISISHV